MEREGNERLKSAGFVLQFAGAKHVVDPFFSRLDVAVQHGHVRSKPQAMGGPVDVEVALRSTLVVRDFASDAIREDLRAPARQRVEPRVHQLAKDLFVALAVQVREERY